MSFLLRHERRIRRATIHLAMSPLARNLHVLIWNGMPSRLWIFLTQPNVGISTWIPLIVTVILSRRLDVKVARFGLDFGVLRLLHERGVDF